MVGFGTYGNNDYQDPGQIGKHRNGCPGPAMPALRLPRLARALHLSPGTVQPVTQKLGGRHFASSGLAAAVLDSTHALVVTLDRDGRITGFNRACELLTEYEADEVMGTLIWDVLLPGEAIEPIQRFFSDLRNGGELPEEYESAWLTRDGRRPVIAWNNSTLRDASGNVELIISIGVDISEKKAASERLDRAQRIAKIGGWEWTIANDTEYWSDQLFVNLGLEPGSVTPSVEAFYARVHPEDRENVREKMMLAVETLQPYSADFRIVWPDGTIRTVHEEAEVVLEANGKAVAVAGTLQDVTELRETESRLKQITDSYANAQRIARIGNWDWDASTKAEWWSDEVYRIMGVEVGGVTPCFDNFLARAHPDDRAKVSQAIKAAQDTLGAYDITFRLVRADGVERVVRETGESLLDEHGRLAGLAGTTQDVTEQYYAERGFADTARRLEAAMRLTRLGNWEWDPDSNRLVMSEETLRICGLGPERAVVDNEFLMAMIPDEERAVVLAKMNRAVATDEAYTNEYHIVRPDGDERSVIEHGEAYRDEYSGKVKLIGTIQDITERKRIERALQESEARLRAIFENAPVGIGLADLKGHLIEVNQRHADFLGYTREEMAGLTYRDFTHPDHMESTARQVAALLAGEVANISAEKQYIRSDGTFVWGARTASLIRDASGNPDFVVTVINDIDDRKKTERKLALATNRLREAQRIAHIGHWEWRSESPDTVWSDEMFLIFGLEPRSIRTTRDSFFNMVHVDDRQSVAAMMSRTIENGDPYETEFRIFRADGVMRHVYEKGERYIDEETGEASIRGVLQDITERKAADDKLRETMQNLEDSQRVAKLGSWVWDIETDKEWWSDEIYRIYGLEVGSVVMDGFEFLNFVHPADRKRVRALVEKSVREGTPYSAEYRVRRADGREIILSEQGETEFDADGKPTRMRGIAQDVTEKRKAEITLRELKERLEEAQKLGQMGSWTWEPEENIEWWSDEQYRIFGLEPGSVFLDGWSFLNFVHPDDRDRVEKIERHAAYTLTPFSVEYRVIRPDGTERTVFEQGEWIEDDSSGRPQWRGIVQDITDRKRTEQELARLNTELERRVEERTAELRAAQEELVKSERLATLGQLTATVSHELRNPLGAMRTSMYVVEKKAETGEGGMHTAIQRVNRNITRCDQIIDELLDYTRISNLDLQEREIDGWLNRLMGEQIVPDGVAVARKFGARGVVLPIDSDRLRRAFINIFENACQAAASFKEEDGKPRQPRVCVETQVKDDRLEIAVSDNGPGVPENIREKVFEPLFSTKSFGVGLGLPTVRQIMEQHGGGVEIGSRCAGGAIFVLWLPLKSAPGNPES